MRRFLLVVTVCVFAAEALAVSRRGRSAGIGSAFDRVAGSSLRSGKSLLAGVWRYAFERVADALDVVEANVAIGPGLKVGVEYAVLRTTLGSVQAQRLGMDSRQIGAWSERNVAFGIFPVSLLFAPFELVKDKGDAWEALAVGGFEIGTVGMERTSREAFATTDVLYLEAVMAGPWHERPGDIASVGAEVHLLLVGARARVKPLEFVDFLLGFVGIDLDPRLAHPDVEGARRR